MLKLSKFLGAILLVSGTSIGAAMLALPITTSFMGFVPSIFLFVICWLCMLLSGFFFAEIYCHFKKETNLVTMASQTLGKTGKLICWSFYLMLLYSLIAAYIAGSAPMFVGLFEKIGVNISLKTGYFCLPVLFGVFFYFGIKGIDLINRVLMIGLFISYFIILFFTPSYMSIKNLSHFDISLSWIAIPIVLTSFGFHIIIPSIGHYLDYDKKKLKKAIFFGSLLTLGVYLLWQVLILGVVPLEGPISLAKSWLKGDAIVPLSSFIGNSYIAAGSYAFAFFAIVTSFLGVALALSDFLVDGFKIKKTWEGHLLAYSLTFLPPIVFVLQFQRGFITALEYSGVFVAVLLGILPCLMLLKLKNNIKRSWRHKTEIFFVFAVSIFFLVASVLNNLGYFNYLMEKYIP